MGYRGGFFCGFIEFIVRLCSQLSVVTKNSFLDLKNPLQAKCHGWLLTKNMVWSNRRKDRYFERQASNERSAPTFMLDNKKTFNIVAGSFT